MSNISDTNLRLVSQSLALLHHRKGELAERMDVILRGASGEREPFGQSEMAATALVEFLLDHAQSLIEKGQFAGTKGVAEEHRVLDIDGRHYSRFGDALIPILTELLGPRLPAEVPAAWCDLFWSAIRLLTVRMAA